MVEKRGRRPSLDSSKDLDAHAIFIELQRLRALVGNPEAISHVFILWSLRKLSDAQRRAADRVTDIYRRWHLVQEQRPNPRSPGSNLIPSGNGGTPKTPEQKLADERETLAAWEKLQRCFSQVRKDERTLVMRLCVENVGVTQAELNSTVYRVLNVIAQEFDLGEPDEVAVTSLAPVARKSKPRVTRQEKVATDTYVWRGEGIEGPGTPKEREAKIADMLARNALRVTVEGDHP